MSETGFRQNPWLIVVGVSASVLLSLWSCAIDGIINNDGVYYILAAEHFAEGEWRAALGTFKWPGYPFLIFLVERLPGIDYELAAHVVTTVGFTLAVLAFVSVVHALGGRGRVLWLALVTILAYPGFNEFRSFVIRDALYLAFYLLALSALLRYGSSGRARDLVAVVMYLLLGALFRVEALAFALLAPGVLLLHDANRSGTRLALISGYFLLVVPILALFYGWWIYRPEPGESPWLVLAKPWRLVEGVLAQSFSQFAARMTAVEHGSALAGAAESAGLAIWLVFRETVEAITLPFLGILLYESVKGRVFTDWPRAAVRILAAVAGVNVVLLLVFALAKFFVTPRYPVALATTLVLAVPFALERYLAFAGGTANAVRRRGAAALVIFLVAINLAEGLDNFSDKHYLREAGLWLREHAGRDDKLASNDLKFLFYAGRYGEKWVAFPEQEEFKHFLSSGQWRLKDYIAVNIRRKDPDLERLVARMLPPPVETFNSERGDKMLLFRTMPR